MMTTACSECGFYMDIPHTGIGIYRIENSIVVEEEDSELCASCLHKRLEKEITLLKQ